jgi:hypothetical protein
MSIKSSLSSTLWSELPNICLFPGSAVLLLCALGELLDCFVFAGDFTKGPLRVSGLLGLERNGDLFGDLLESSLLLTLILHSGHIHSPVNKIMIMKICCLKAPL